jgi:2'-5' RNA ligase
MGIKRRWLKLGHLSVYDLSTVYDSLLCFLWAMQEIRSFIAIPLAAEVRRAAIRLIKRLSEPDDGIKWVPTDNLHLTLKFLGDVNNTEVPRVCDVLREICAAHEPFDLELSGTGGFPEIERPRVLYAGVTDPSQSLTQIVENLELELAELGFKPEPRDYRPHLTLGRTKSGSRRANSEVIERLKREQSTLLGNMRVDKIHVFASFLDKGGPTYQVMDTVSL